MSHLVWNKFKRSAQVFILENGGHLKLARWQPHLKMVELGWNKFKSGAHSKWRKAPIEI